jgi:hypothetical protein
MLLTVIACGLVGPADGRGGYTVRLVGLPGPEEIAPPRLLEAADRSLEALRAIYPDWLWQWVQTSGILDLAVYSGPISWWWYSPASEMSPMRSGLIRDLYWLLLLRTIIREHGVTSVTWFGDDPALATVAGAMARGLGASFDCRLRSRPMRTRLWIRMAGRLRFAIVHSARCLLLRMAGFGRIPPGGTDAVLYSRFPVLWEARDGVLRERLFGDWPLYLGSKGLDVAFVALFIGPLRHLLVRRQSLRTQCRESRIVFVEALASFRDVAMAHFDIAFGFRYMRWRSHERHRAILFKGIDVSTLIWREVDANAVSGEGPYNRVLSKVTGRALDALGPVKMVCVPFEFQPMERAVTLAAQQRGIPVVGIQAALWTSNQMGFSFPASQVRTQLIDGTRAPLPDVMAAYGMLPHQLFVERLGADRVCLSGPIRYSHLARPADTTKDALLRRAGFSMDSVVVLVALSPSRAESLAMLEAAFIAAALRTDVVIALRFHYFLPLHIEAREIAQRFRAVRYRVCDGPFDDLLAASSVLICGGSSAGIEAIARDCVPLVFRHVGDVPANATLEVPDAAFFWQTAEDLGRALNSALSRDREYQVRHEHWPSALRRQLWPIDRHISARLYDFLRAKGLVSGVDAVAAVDRGQ